jgi:hypothetical protein
LLRVVLFSAEIGRDECGKCLSESRTTNCLILHLWAESRPKL